LLILLTALLSSLTLLSMAKRTRIGLRAITMQQPFAAAMVHGQGLFTRRGKPVSFGEEGEWLAIHCGANDTHLKNESLMEEVRAQWPECPSNEDLKAAQKHLVGVANFVETVGSTAKEAKGDFFVSHYPECSKKFAWRASSAVPCKMPVHYPKGQVQIWHVCEEGFGDTNGQKGLLGLLPEIGVTETKGCEKKRRKEQIQPTCARAREGPRKRQKSQKVKKEKE
jgi:hypothetical protein